MKTDLHGLVAVSKKSKGIKPLGYLTWFSVPDEQIGLRKLRSTLASCDLNPDLAPRETKALHIFKRAVREQAGAHRMNGHVIEAEVREVEETTTDCVYQVSFVVRDLDQRVIDYPKAIRMVFNKKTERVSPNFLGDRDAPRKDVHAISNAILDFYEANSSKVTGARVRTIVRTYLRSTPSEELGVDGLSGENMRGRAGGIYFIPARHVGALESLADALNELYPGRAYLHAVPMADGDSEREIIRRHHLANMQDDITDAIAECRGLLSNDRDRAPRSDVKDNKWAEFRALERRASEYAHLLEEEQDEIADKAAVLHEQLKKLA